MAKPLLTTTISAPGFLGINTQESSVDLSSGYALEAYNCVIDEFGRIGARKGWVKQNSSTNVDLDEQDIQFIFELPETGTVIVGGQDSADPTNKALLLTWDGTTLATAVQDGASSGVRNDANSADVTYSISSSNWSASSIVYGEGPDIKPHAYLAQANHLPLVYHQLGASHAHTGSYGFNRLMDCGSVPSTYASASDFKPNVVLGAYGRTWWADITNDEQTVYFSALLDGSNLSTGDSGYLSLVDVFPNGDEVVGLAAHNGFLIIFGKRNIAVYANPIDVTSLTLADLITNVGCIARDSIASTGTDVMFLSDTGVRSIARVIQEKSAPINDISFNIRDDLVRYVTSQGTTRVKIKGIYYPEDAFYILSIPESTYVFCFDLRARLQNGAARATIWDSIKPTALHVTYDGKLLLGRPGYVAEYKNHYDNVAYDGTTTNATTYKLRYYTNHFDLGSPTSLKFLKKANFTVIGGVGQDVFIKYGFDYVASYNVVVKQLVAGSVSEFNIAEYNVDEYSSGLELEEVRSNLGGSGSVVQLGFEADISNNPLSIQKIDVYVKAGKTV